MQRRDTGLHEASMRHSAAGRFDHVADQLELPRAPVAALVEVHHRAAHVAPPRRRLAEVLPAHRVAGHRALPEGLGQRVVVPAQPAARIRLEVGPLVLPPRPPRGRRRAHLQRWCQEGGGGMVAVVLMVLVAAGAAARVEHKALVERFHQPAGQQRAALAAVHACVGRRQGRHPSRRAARLGLAQGGEARAVPAVQVARAEVLGRPVGPACA